MAVSGTLLLLALCWSPAQTQVAHLTDMFGSIYSPNFPESYPKESDVQWNISVPDGYQIRLYFMRFDLEPSYLCEYDFVKVLWEQEEAALFCGRESTDTEQVPGDDVITSPGSMLSVAFHSDFSNEERYTGFEAHYSAVDVDECRDRNDEDLVCDHFCHNYIGGFYCTCRYGYLLHSDNRTCKVECSDSVYTERSGVISSSDFPRPYPKSSDCVYRIELEEGFLVTLDFDETFDIEDHPEVACPYDHIKVVSSQTEFGPFCGERSPGRIQTGSNAVRILFHSDNSGENLGWRVTYTSVAGSECRVPVVPPNGRVEPVQSQYFFKDHVLIICEPGYSLRKDNEELEYYQIQCQRDGTWTSDVPPCEKIDCGLPGEVAGGDVVYESFENSTVFGSTIQYRCLDAGNQSSPESNRTYVCNSTGQWVSSELGAKLPSCIPGCGEPSRPFPAQQKRVVGGRVAPAGLFPWQVLLSVRDVSRVPEDRWFGSGALLSPSWVLTAAHVLRSQRRDPSVVPLGPQHVLAHLGLVDVREKHRAVTRSVAKVILHPLFDPRNYDNDIALVQLQQEVPLSALVRPVCLPPPPLPPDPSRPPTPLPHTLGLVAGWGVSAANASLADGGGATFDPGAASETLQYVKLPVVRQEECEASYASRSRSYNITQNMFCAGFYEGGRDTCLGDSGGAFVTQDPSTARWVVQGLVSWGGPEECGSQRVYGVYTRVGKYAHWLHSYLDVAPWW